MSALDCTQISMGHGLVDVTHIEYGGRIGLFLRPRAEAIPVGEPGELLGGDYWPVPGDVVIWMDNLAGLAVVLREVIQIGQTLASPPEATGAA